MRLRVDAHSPVSIRQRPSEPLEHVIEGGGVPGDQARPSMRELVGFLGSNSNTAGAIEDLKRSGYRPLRPSPETPEPSSVPGAPAVKGRDACESAKETGRG